MVSRNKVEESKERRRQKGRMEQYYPGFYHSFLLNYSSENKRKSGIFIFGPEGNNKIF